MSRLSSERGSGVVAGLTLMFALTFLGLVWLARDVDRSVSNRTAAQSIAFQSARSGAQQLEIAELRDGGQPVVDAGEARLAAQRTAATLFASYAVTGRVVDLRVRGDEVTVRVSIDDSGRPVTGLATVRAARRP